MGQAHRRELPQVTAEGLTPNSLLDRLEANLIDYRRSAPNLFCTEHAEAKRFVGDDPDGTIDGWSPPAGSRGKEVEMKSVATFRLRRTTEEGSVGSFEESRVLQLVDGKPPASSGAPFIAPALLYGVFSNGLNILSKEGRGCFAFRLRKTGSKQPIVVDFADLPKKEREKGCPAFENTSGHISVDPASLHVLRIEKRIPRTALVPGVFGSWEWTEEYAPVTLLDKTFWMPKHIHSHSASTEGLSLIWDFSGTYDDYHLFHSESHIVPASPSF